MAEAKTYIQTKAGLPTTGTTTCALTGQPITEGHWYARSVVDAQSGNGISEAAFAGLQAEGKARLADNASTPAPAAPTPKVKGDKDGS